MSVALVLILLAATLPLAAVGWVAALVAERLKVDAAMRGRLWLAALVAPLALAPALPLGWVAHALTPAPTLAAPSGPTPVLPAPVAWNPAPAATAASPAAPMGSPRPYGAILLVLVAGGVAVRLGLLTLRLARASRLRARTLRAEPPVLQGPLRAQAARLGVRPPALRLWDGSQPVLVGLRRPAILLPRRLAFELDETRLGLILAHELGHLRAGDPWRMAVAELAGALMWFNPFCRFSLIALAQVREEICDAVVLKGVDRPTRRTYAETLMAALREQAGVSPALAFTGARRRTAQRMAAILRPSPVSPRRAALCAGAGALALGGSLGGLAFAAAGVLPAPARLLAAPSARPLAIASSPSLLSSAVSQPSSPGAPSAAPSAIVGVTQQAGGQLQLDGADAAAQFAATALQRSQTDVVQMRSQYALGQVSISQLLAAEGAVRGGQAELASAQAAKAQLELSLVQAGGAASASQLAALSQAAVQARTASDAVSQSSAQAALVTAQRELDNAQARYGQGLAILTEVAQARVAVLRAQAALLQASQGAPAQLAQAAPIAPPAAATVTIVGESRPTTVYDRADWASKPTPAQMAAVYPARALEAGMRGDVTLSCDVDVGGRVANCTVVNESPRGETFGAAALKLQGFFKMRPKLQDGYPVAGTATLAVPFVPPSPPAPTP